MRELALMAMIGEMTPTNPSTATNSPTTPSSQLPEVKLKIITMTPTYNRAKDARKKGSPKGPRTSG